jgi:hypothetical protein
MRVKMTLTFPGETIEELRTFAKSEGFLSPNLLARHLVVSGLRRLKKGEQGIYEFFDFIAAKRNTEQEGNRE